MNDSFWNDIFLASLFPTRNVSITTRSGRKFRFNITDFRIYPTTTDVEIADTTDRIVAEKYRYCLWDRMHPTVNSEVEIRVSLSEFLTGLVNKMKRHQTEREGNRSQAGLDCGPVNGLLSGQHGCTPVCIA